MIIDFLQHQLTAKNAQGLHSPFVFRLYTEVIKAEKRKDAFEKIEGIRRSLLRSSKTIEVADFGAGSRVHKSNLRQVSRIARYSTVSPKQGRLLHRLLAFMRPQNVLELGTSFGLGSLYLASAMPPEAQMWTLEGCHNTADMARQHFAQFAFPNLHLQVGNIDEHLEPVLAQMPQLDFAFLDANHAYAPTLRYFELCLNKASDEALLIFDDIHWSADMKRAWQQICEDSRIGLSIDLFYFGLAFLRKKQAKQHFRLRF